MRIFYRVQHRDSFTKFDPAYGFESNARYVMAYDLWINKENLERHLDWNDRSKKPTPFVSVFDNFGMTMTQRLDWYRPDSNLGEAEEWARSLVDSGFYDVRIVEICPGLLQRYIVPFNNEVDLPVWISVEKTLFIKTGDAREHLGVQNAMSQLSEWFAIEWIPANMISRIQKVGGSETTRTWSIWRGYSTNQHRASDQKEEERSDLNLEYKINVYE